MAQLLSDNSHFPLRVSIFEGETKGSNLFSVREFGNNCLLYTLDEVLRYADVLNLIQTDICDSRMGEVCFFCQSIVSPFVFFHQFSYSFLCIHIITYLSVSILSPRMVA